MMSPINANDFPNEYNLQINYWQKNAQSIINNYTNKTNSFLFGCQPNLAINMPTAQIIYLLSKRFGDEKVRQCLNPDFTFLSPITENTDSQWIKSVSMVGVNVRTIGSFWSLVKYAFTLPGSVSSIHLLPIWECGVVDSLYGMASWYINTEFFDKEVAVQFPHLDTAEKQLKVVINMLHLMGKTIGFDVVPHTDRYSEISLANPYHFEWLQRKDYKILDHSDKLTDKVAQSIVDFVNINGSKSGDYFPRIATDFFDNEQNNEDVRLRILFGKKENKEDRNNRRNQLISFLFEKGFEPVPATMAPPYRSLIVDPAETAKTIDKEGRIWRDYLIEKPQEMSRVFGPLARYKLYESKDDNFNWELDFTKPKANVFEYVAEKYLNVCLTYNFDFMRGDMSHVQMNPEVSENEIDEFYDIHKFVKNHIKKSKPSFGYFAESFLVADNIMAYGNEANHLNYSDTDSTLGNLQSYAMSDPEFYQEFYKYFKLVQTNSFAPNFTIFTADKDDPRFDQFYWDGNTTRYFIGMFFKYLPSYNSLGFEIRDEHNQPAPNEFYTKLYVFHMEDGPKSTKGPYQWGKNGAQFAEIQAVNYIADQIFSENEKPIFSMISDIEKFTTEKILMWNLEIGQYKYLFVVNFFNGNKSKKYDLPKNQKLKLIYKYNCELNLNHSLSMNSYSQAIFKYEI
jgi:hypothetical protein